MGGLVTDIQPPNLETRMAILRKKSEIDGFHLPNEVVQYIAHHATSNIRELEGILVKLIASSSFTGRDITLDVAMEMCGDILLSRKEPLGTRHIIERVAEHFNVSPHQLSAHTRRRDVTLPRSVAMYLCKKLTRQSLRTIGLDFGGRDYSTVLHACRKIEEKLLNDAELNFAVIELEDELQNPQ